MSDVTSECDKSTTLISYMSVVTSDLNSLSTWASDWCVNFNASKTKPMLFTRKHDVNIPP